VGPEAAQKRAHLRSMEALQTAVLKLQDELDLKVFRPLQKRAFDASSKCCDSNKSRGDFQRCLERAGQPTVETEAQVMHELNAFQGRVQRCVVQCQDKAQALVDSKGVDAAQANMEKCVNECGTFYKKEIDGIGAKLMKQYKP